VSTNGEQAGLHCAEHKANASPCYNILLKTIANQHILPTNNPNYNSSISSKNAEQMFCTQK
jgi:hypothetical protein